MKIIVADDHSLVRAGLVQLLKSISNSFEIFEAKNYQEVMEQAQNNIDLLLLDLDMPGVGSVKIIKQICEKMPTTAVVVVSANESQHILKACMDAGTMGFIPKTSSTQVMRSAIQLVFSGELYAPYALTSQKYKKPNEKVTPRQEEIWKLLVDGLSNKAIARELDLTEGTIKQHLSTLFKTLKVKNRYEAIKKAREVWG